LPPSLRMLWQRLTSWLGLAGFLCDTCQFDHPAGCRNPKRPNVSVCKDHRKR